MGNEKIDLHKLSERELLILLNNKVECMNTNQIKMAEDYIELHTRVVKIETRNKMVSATWGVGSVLITILINLLNYLKHVWSK